LSFHFMIDSCSICVSSVAKIGKRSPVGARIVPQPTFRTGSGNFRSDIPSESWSETVGSRRWTEPEARVI
jgi:hypothetical protein